MSEKWQQREVADTVVVGVRTIITTTKMYECKINNNNKNHYNIFLNATTMITTTTITTKMHETTTIKQKKTLNTFTATKNVK